MLHTYVRLLVCSFLYVVLAQFALIAFLQKPGSPPDFERARLTNLVDGTAHRPFVYRTAFPTALRLVRALIPIRVQDRMAQTAQTNPTLKQFMDSTPADENRDPALYLTAYAMEFISLILFALLLRAMIQHFYSVEGWVADLLPLGALLGLPVFYRYISYDYDFPNLFVFTLGLFLLARRAWWLYYLWLPVCVMAKETALLLVVIHVLVGPSNMPLRWVLHTTAQLSILGVVRGLLQFVVFRDNPGVPVEFWLYRNWEMVSNPEWWGFLFFHFTWVGKMSLIMPTNYNALFLLLVPLVVGPWSQKPVFLRRALWTLPLLIGLAFFFGYVDEMRDYYEAYPVVYLLGAGAICNSGAAGGARTLTRRTK